MAGELLTAPYPDLFRQTILTNLDYWQGWVQVNLNDAAAMEREHQRIVRAIGYALELEATWPAVAELIIRFSPFMERWGRWEVWNQALERAITAARLKEDTARQTTLTALLGRLLFQQSCFKESVYCYRQTIRLARQVGDRFNEARVCSNLGFYYAEHGQWWRAELLCCHALNIFEQLGSDHGRAHTENHLGVLYKRQHRWELAQQHLERACEIWQTMGDEHGLMRGYLNLGGFYRDVEQSPLALSYLEKALRLAQVTGENITIGIIYINMGMSYRSVGDLAQAETYLRQAETIFERYSNWVELSRVWNDLGLTYYQQDRPDQAFFYLEKSLEVWRNLGIKFEEIEVLLDIIECELRRGNIAAAAVRLQEVECLLGPTPAQGPYRHRLPRLAEYRRRLAEGSPGRWSGLLTG